MSSSEFLPLSLAGVPYVTHNSFSITPVVLHERQRKAAKVHYCQHETQLCRH